MKPHARLAGAAAPPDSAPFARAATLACVAVLAGSASGSAQETPEKMARASELPGWEVSFSPRIGFFLPQDGGGRGAVRRPTYGMELVARRKGSWYGARALFERSMRWDRQRDVAGSVLSGGRTVFDDDPDTRFFETAVVDAMAFTPTFDGVRAYTFAGIGSKIIGSPEETAIPILPYSLAGAERARTWHGGLGIEAPLGGGAAVFEVGDYYGRNGGEGSAHDFHLTLMARLPGIADMVRTLVAREDPDG